VKDITFNELNKTIVGSPKTRPLENMDCNHVFWEITTQTTLNKMEALKEIRCKVPCW
jgi:hypothetical protein